VVAGEKVQTAVGWGKGIESRSVPLLQQVFDFIESDHIAPESQFSPDLPLANPDASASFSVSSCCHTFYRFR
jgi:hypothetical protein